MQRPTCDEIVAAIREEGSIRKAATKLVVPESTLRYWIKKDPDLAARLGHTPRSATPGVVIEGDRATLTEPATHTGGLGDIEALIRDRGLDPSEWVVITTTLNQWEAPGQDGTQLYRQWKVTLRRSF